MNRLIKLGKILIVGAACLCLALMVLVVCAATTWAGPLIFIDFFSPYLNPSNPQETVAYAYLLLTSIVSLWLTHRIASRLIGKYILK